MHPPCSHVQQTNVPKALDKKPSLRSHPIFNTSISKKQTSYFGMNYSQQLADLPNILRSAFTRTGPIAKP